MHRLYLSLALLAGLVAYFFFKSDDSLAEYEHWFQMTWKEQDVGYMHRQTSLHDQYYEIRSVTQVNTANQGVDFSYNERHIMRFSLTAEQPLISSYYRLESPHNYTETQLTKTDKGYRLKRQVNNKLSEAIVAADYSLTDYLKLQEWLYTEPEKGQTLSSKTLNPTTLQFSEANYLVQNVINNSIIVSYQSTDNKDIKTLIVDQDGVISEYGYNDIIRLTRVDNASDLTIRNTEDYYATQMIPVDKPIGNPMQWQRIKLQVNNSELLQQLSSDQRQVVQDNILILDADISARARTEESEQYFELPSDEKLQRRLLNMAQPVTASHQEPIVKLTALREYVSAFISDVPRIQSIDLKELLDNPEGDCTEHATLFNALASSLGFKVRTVNGLVYLGDTFQGFGGHQWSEVLIDGYWVGFDPTWDINTLSATHIRFKDNAEILYFSRSANEKGYKFTLVARE